MGTQLKTLLEKLSFNFLEIWTSCWNLVHAIPETATGFFQLLMWPVCLLLVWTMCLSRLFQVDSKGGLAENHGPGCLKWVLKQPVSFSWDPLVQPESFMKEKNKLIARNSVCVEWWHLVIPLRFCPYRYKELWHLYSAMKCSGGSLWQEIVSQVARVGMGCCSLDSGGGPVAITSCLKLVLPWICLFLLASPDNTPFRLVGLGRCMLCCICLFLCVIWGCLE